MSVKPHYGDPAADYQEMELSHRSKRWRPFLGAISVLPLLVGLVVAPPAASAVEEESAQSSATSTTFSVEASDFPAESDQQAWQALAEDAANFDPYKIYEGEITRRQAVVERFVAINEANVSGLQPSIEEFRALHAEQDSIRQGRQLVVDHLGGRLSSLAIQNFKAGNDYSAIPVDVTGSGEFEQRRRNEQTFERVVDGSAGDFKDVKYELAEIVRIQAEVLAKLQAAEAEQEQHQKQLILANALAEDFANRVQERASAIDQLSFQAMASEQAGIPLFVVGPLTVSEVIAERVALLLAAAEQDGIIFGGWGHRSVARQIELRRAHCGDSEWAIFDRPSGECSPPTARPGHSQHEVGLAIDFTENGSVLTRSSPGYFWLKQHAHEYGLKNLPSEAWHWSTTGN